MHTPAQIESNGMSGYFWGRVFFVAQFFDDDRFDIMLGTSSHRMIEIDPIEPPPPLDDTMVVFDDLTHGARTRVRVSEDAYALVDELFAESEPKEPDTTEWVTIRDDFATPKRPARQTHRPHAPKKSGRPGSCRDSNPLSSRS